MAYKLPTQAIEPSNITQSLLADDVKNALVPVGGIIMWSGSVAEIANLTAWELCDGLAGRPNLQDKFVVGAGSTYNPDDFGGEATKLLGTANLPSHTHQATGTIDITDVGHSHTTSFDGNKYFPGAGTTNIGYGGAGGYPADVFSMNDTNIASGLTATATINVQEQGGAMGQAFDILPPYYALAYIIRVL